MSDLWRALRRRIITPDVSETSLEVRGFHPKNEASKEILENVGKSFLAGYAIAAEAKDQSVAGRRIDELPPRFRGFAFEGAAMAYAVIDGLSPWRRDNSPRFLIGPGDPHVYMAYVGIGWAMARVPRFRWSRLTLPDPLLRWLALDGYGFHQAYFRTDRYVYGRYRDPSFTWHGGGPQSYVPRAVDQGIGRAMWFVYGTDPVRVADAIDGFEPERHQDLYSGAGLAATYAGGVDEEELRTFWNRAGEHQPFVAQASAFAAEARIRAGLLVPHTELATRVFCGMPAVAAASLTVQRRPEGPDGDQLPAYELWRQQVAQEFAAIGRK
ncbi:DUF1702 family protein [Micromonospora sp. WMMD882]|uniref:DUF1702 family protein n=1 Tax=Micromonospora sp. WMMD882 TaxID=3015151 RepID=UPI00248C9AB6|nr:DUF1702 family protein [Micromonospora sp. WMMD882]WBB80691.1 DUF1702 family protein [Micromonospora sp. WMMD882]